MSNEIRILILVLAILILIPILSTLFNVYDYTSDPSLRYEPHLQTLKNVLIIIILFTIFLLFLFIYTIFNIERTKIVKYISLFFAGIILLLYGFKFFNYNIIKSLKI